MKNNFTNYKIAGAFLAFILFSFAYNAGAQNIVTVIDAGHGFTTSGDNADGRTTTEIYTALAAAEKLRDMIQENNCDWTVHLTRTTNGPGGWSSLTQRATMSNNWNATRFLSIHCNAGGGTGTETFYCNQSASSTALDQAFALEIQADMVTHGQWNSRRCVEDYSYLPYHLGVLRNTNAPACLSEIGFVDYASDASKLNSDSWRDKFALAYYNALQDELGACPGANVSSNVAPLGSLHYVTTELSSSYGAAKAFDGSVGTRWNSNGAGAANYFMIRLDKTYNISEFRVKHASSAGLSSNLNTERYYAYYWNGSAWVAVVSNYNNSTKAGVTSHSMNVTSQYVCLYVTDPTFTSDLYSRIPEFEVYGSSSKMRTTDQTPPAFEIFGDVSLASARLSANPNPVTDGRAMFVVDLEEDTNAALELVDLHGRVVKVLPRRVYNAGRNDLEVDLSGFSAGVYFYRLRNDEGVSGTKKLVVL